MLSLTWPQVSTWRLSQHHLNPRLPSGDLLHAAADSCGIQAQVMSAAEMALGNRVERLCPAEVQAALWQDRSLLRTWAMRGTLHLLTAVDYPLLVAARQAKFPGNWTAYLEYFGIPGEMFEPYLEVAPQILSAIPTRREAFARELGKRLNLPTFTELILGGNWGTFLKPLAWRGHLAFGPVIDGSKTYVHPQEWTGYWRDYDPQEALQEVIRRYLGAFGPATIKDFSQWWEGGTGLTQARQAFKAIEAELEEVEVEGWKAWARQDTLPALKKARATGSVRLLGPFDAYVLGIGRGAEIAPLLPVQFQKAVYRPQGWISAVIVADGVILGTWEQKTRSAGTIITLKPFAPLPDFVKKGIEIETARLSDYWDKPAAVEVADSP